MSTDPGAHESDPPLPPGPPPERAPETDNDILTSVDAYAAYTAVLDDDDAADADDPSHWDPPDGEALAAMLPGYQVISLIGRGGMGAVYRCRDMELDRIVAVKLLPPALGRRPGFARRFEREAWALAQLSHPNIVAIHARGETADGHLFFSMEFVEGTDLAHLINAGLRARGDASRPLMEKLQVLDIARQVAAALAFAHDKGLVHRDIKPANILITPDGRVKVADFGLARPVVDATPAIPQMTLAGQVVGTPDYMAPELRDGGSGDARGDLFSLGVLIYQMLTGSLPRGAFLPPSQLVATDSRFDAVVLRALQPTPEDRFADAAAFIAALEPLYRDPPRRRSRRLAATAGVSAIAAAIALAFPQSRPGMPTAPAAATPAPDPAEVLADLPRPPVVPDAHRAPGDLPFVAIPDLHDVLFCRWEVRRRDYAAFAAATGRTKTIIRPEQRELDPSAPALTWQSPGFAQEDDAEPVVCVSWADAIAFCDWLTNAARENRRLGPADRYRLPSDREWSVAAGLATEGGRFPWERHARPALYSWGRQFPPRAPWENFAGSEARPGVLPTTDPFPRTAPVGRFPPMANGLHDLGGNVREWTADREDFAGSTHAARSSGYRSTKSDDLLLARRSNCYEDRGNDTLGFRLVLDRPTGARASLATRAEAAIAAWRADHASTGFVAWLIDEALHLRIDLTGAAPLRSAAAFAGLPIAEFSATLAPDADLSALRGLPLVAVRLAGPLTDLSPLSGTRLEWLAVDLSGTPAPDLAGLAAPGLRSLAILRADPLRAWPDALRFPALRHLDCDGSRLPDFAALAPMALDHLGLDHTEPVPAEALATLTKVRSLPAWPACFRPIDALRDAGRLDDALSDLADFSAAIRDMRWFDGSWRSQIIFRESALGDPTLAALESWQAHRSTWPPPGTTPADSGAFAIYEAALRPVSVSIEAARLGAHPATLSGPEDFSRALTLLRSAGTTRPAFVGATRPRPDLPWAWVTAEPWTADEWLPAEQEDAAITLLIGEGEPTFFPGSHRSVGHAIFEWSAPDAPDPCDGLATRLIGAWHCEEDGTRFEFLPHGRLAGRVFDEACWLITRAAAGEVLLLTDYNRRALLLKVPEKPSAPIPAIAPDGSRRTLVR